MKKTAKLLSLLLALILTFGVIGVASAEELEGDIVIVTGWNETESQGEVFIKLAEDFEKLHPNVNVELQFLGREMKDIIKPMLEGGQQVDIMTVGYIGNKSPVEDWLYDLDNMLNTVYPTTDGKPLKDTLVPIMEATCKNQLTTDRNLAVGYAPTMTSILYNKDIFEAAGITKLPETWEELDAVCAQLKEAGYVPFTVDDAYAVWTPGIWFARAVDQDYTEALINDTTGEMWRDETVLKMAKSMEDFAAKGYFHENVGGNRWPAGQIDFANGGAAMIYNATWLPTELEPFTGGAFNWGYFTFPDVVEGATKHLTEETVSCQMIGINKNSEHIEICEEFLAFFLSKENNQYYVDVTQSMPAVLDVEWPAALADIRPLYEGMEVALDNACRIDWNGDLTPVLTENCTKLFAGEITAEQFVENMVAAAKQ